jgi:hypothetical protein
MVNPHKGLTRPKRIVTNVSYPKVEGLAIAKSTPVHEYRDANTPPIVTLNDVRTVLFAGLHESNE